MTGSGFALLGYVLGPNLRPSANVRQTLNSDAAGIGGGSISLLAIHDQIPAAQCATPDAYIDTMIVVVTY
jgi:spore coat protein U-like protein